MADGKQPMNTAPQLPDILGVLAELLRRSGAVLGLLVAGLGLANLLLGFVDGIVFPGDRPGFGLISFTLLAVPLFAGAAAHRVLWDWSPGLSESLDVGTKAYVQLLGVIIISRIIVSVGLALLVLPGLVAIIFLSLAPVIIISEGPGIGRAIGESVQRIAGAFVQVLLAYLVFGIGMLIAAFAVSFPLTLLTGGSERVMGAAVGALFSIGHVVFATAIYLALQGRSGPQPAMSDA